MPGLLSTPLIFSRTLSGSRCRILRRSRVHGAVLGITAMGFVELVLAVCPNVGKDAYRRSEVIQMTVLLKVMAYQVFDAAIVLRCAQRSGRHWFTMAVAVGASALVFIPAVYFLPLLIPPPGARPAVWCISKLSHLCACRFRRGHWKSIRLVLPSSCACLDFRERGNVMRLIPCFIPILPGDGQWANRGW